MGSESLLDEKAVDARAVERILADRKALLQNLHALSGKEIVERLLEHENPQEIVTQLPSHDFYWMVKKIGEDDCLPLLRYASVGQWQHVLDLEIWRKARLSVGVTALWLERLLKADTVQLVGWLMGEGTWLAYYFFSRSIEVAIKHDQDDFVPPVDSFTIDGVIYVRTISSKQRDLVEKMIRAMASEDIGLCRSILLGVARVIPAELEEDMYRMKNVRLGEHGFLRFDEAVAVYAPLDPKDLRSEKAAKVEDVPIDGEVLAMVPISPLSQTESKTMLTAAVSRTTDPLFLERMHREFAGLCNQIISAEGLPVPDLDALIATCHKAAGYVSLALERLCGEDVATAEGYLRENVLVSLFRVGFGLALQVKWEAESWLKRSWFHHQGFDAAFWGDRWGGILAGFVGQKPRLYVGAQEHGEYRDFERLSELAECVGVLRHLMVLDGLLERLTKRHSLDQGVSQFPELTFQPLIFTFWARRQLQQASLFSGISVAELKSLFTLLRAESEGPPYEMPGWERGFIEDLMSYTASAEPEAAKILEKTLSLIWQDFLEEYRWISVDDLTDKSPFFFIEGK